VVHFALSGSGELTQKDVVSTNGTPTALAVNTAGTFLYVLSTSTSTTTTAPTVSARATPEATTTVHTAVLTAYALSSGTIGTGTAITLTVPSYSSDTIIPTGITVLANNGTITGSALFVSAYDQSAYNPGGVTTSTANPGWVFGFSIGASGALTASSGSPYKAGIKPSAIASDPTDRFVYVTDFASNQLIGYTIQGGSTLDFLVNGPFSTGSEPASISIDPRGKYIYIANQLSNSVGAYVIDPATGTPSSAVNVTGSQINATDTEPVSLVIDPALGRFVYTANVLGNSISGFRLDPNTGALSPTQATPYPTGDAPAAIASVPHGNHSVQTVAP